ncbi:MAG: hypothetical protein QW614_00200 [Candidatus Caldarchaeum sp.]|uniref:Archaeal Type IV pilin N-terminal domain-containing protein n=1 Tax=Caldiarchaeum subterraneum TaxID=311458 RepID=A0A7C5LE31_CALS0
MAVKTGGISYVAGVLLVLAVTISTIALYTTVVGFQSQTILSLSALDIRRASESLVIVEYHRPTSTLVVYNNGLIPTCFVEITVAGMMGAAYSNPNCTPIPPNKATTLTLGLINPPQKLTLIARTIHNKILTYTIS